MPCILRIRSRGLQVSDLVDNCTEAGRTTIAAYLFHVQKFSSPHKMLESGCRTVTLAAGALVVYPGLPMRRIDHISNSLSHIGVSTKVVEGFCHSFFLYRPFCQLVSLMSIAEICAQPQAKFEQRSCWSHDSLLH
jgi:hypothetical protein